MLIPGVSRPDRHFIWPQFIVSNNLLPYFYTRRAPPLAKNGNQRLRENCDFASILMTST